MSTLSLQIFSAILISTSACAAMSIPKNEIDVLNVSLSGRLHFSLPFDRPCFHLSSEKLGSFDPTACVLIQSNYTDSELRLSSPGAYMNTQWSTCQSTSEQCLLDFENTRNPAAFLPPRKCAQGSVPTLYIDVHGQQDVVAAFGFATQHGIPLVVKNTGHDYLGRSAAPDSLELRMQHLQGVSYDEDFQPFGCSLTSLRAAVTFGAGVDFKTLYAFADRKNITIIGPADASIGAAGGWIQGGGHSMLTNAFGLGVDNVLQFKIVTPDGQLRIANACQHRDLFFALRGGGGGTFGVVLEATLKTLPRLTLQVSTVSFTPEIMRDFLQLVIANSKKWATQGWGGFIITSGMTFVTPDLNSQQAAQSMEPVLAFVSQHQGHSAFKLQEVGSYLNFFNGFIAGRTAPNGQSISGASRLIPVTNFASAEKQQILLDAILVALPSHPLNAIFVTTPFKFGQGSETSVTNSWRDSLWHFWIGTTWDWNTDLSDKKVAYHNLTSIMDTIRIITPDSGAYQNEADVYEPDFTRAFWGLHYSKLLAIKAKYDPYHVLDCWHCVGWKGANDRQFRCYIKLD